MYSHLSQLNQILRCRSNRDAKAKALIRSLWWYVYKRLSTKPINLKVFDDRIFRAYPNGFVANSVMLFGEWYEWDTLHFIDSFLRSGDNFLDIGANVGYFTLLASKTTGPGKITCIEPGMQQHRLLSENIAINSLDVNVINCGVGEQKGELTLSAGDAVSHLVTHGCSESTVGAERVRIERLEDIVARQMYPLTKIDVEGFEAPALRGADSLIQLDFLPVIVMEVNGAASRYGSEFAAVNLLRGKGYRFGNYNHDRRVLDFTQKPWGDVIAASQVGIQLLRSRLTSTTINI